MINAIRNYALIIVVFIHTHIFLMSYTQVEAATWLSTFYYNFLSYFHPASLLAAISGFLFFRDFYVHHKDLKAFYKDKYIKRVKSIFIPYFFWVSLFFIVNNLILLANSQSNNAMFESSYTPITFKNYFTAFLFPELAVAKHLWYLNNLLILFLATPLILWLNRFKWIYLMVLVAIPVYYYLNFNQEQDQAQHIVKYRFIIFYLLGAIVALNKPWLLGFLNRPWLFSIISLFIILALHFYENTKTNFALLYMVNSVTVTIVIFFVSVYILNQLFHPHETIYNRSSHFLLYIIHPMLLSLLCKVFFYGHIIEIKNYMVLLPVIFLLTYLIIKITKLMYAFAHKYFNALTLKFL